MRWCWSRSHGSCGAGCGGRRASREHEGARSMTAAGSAILALDIGTSEAKGGLVTTEGRLLATARRGYPMDFDPDTGRAEQDPASWWQALTAITRDLAETGAPIAAVCCVGQA